MAQQQNWDDRVMQFGWPIAQYDPNDIFIQGDIVFELGSNIIAHRYIVGNGFAKTTTQILYYVSS